MRTATQADIRANMHLYEAVARELGISPWLVVRVVLLFSIQVLRETTLRSCCAIPLLGVLFLKYHRRYQRTVFAWSPSAHARLTACIGGFPSDPKVSRTRREREEHRRLRLRGQLTEVSVEKIEALMYREADWAANKQAGERHG